jgi:hypothetical protein
MECPEQSESVALSFPFRLYDGQKNFTLQNYSNFIHAGDISGYFLNGDVVFSSDEENATISEESA